MGTVKNTPNTALLGKTKSVGNDVVMADKTVLLTSDSHGAAKRQNTKSVVLDPEVPTADSFPSLSGCGPPVVPIKLSYSDMAKRVAPVKPQAPPPSQPSQPVSAAKTESSSRPRADLTDDEIRI